MDYFSGIIGQERALVPLRRALETGQINHAYLFIGPGGIGKHTTAAAFARALILMDDAPGQAYIEDNVHPDLMVVEKVENKTLIGIEQINQVMEPWLALKPYRASRRVVIVKEAHLLSLPAANALLKTLEEPPGHAVIIMLSDEPSLLETIVSRCQVIGFSPLLEASIKDLLIDRGIDETDATQLASMGQGSIAAALHLAEEDDREQLWNVARSILNELSVGQEIEVFKCAESMEKNPALLVSLLMNLLRDIYIYQSTGREDLLLMKSNLELAKSFKQIDPARVQPALLIIDDLHKLYRGPVNSLLLSINISYQLWDALK